MIKTTVRSVSNISYVLAVVLLYFLLVGQTLAHTIVSKTNLTPNITVGGIATYQITVGSAGQTSSSTLMRVIDTLPSGFAYRSTQSIQFFNGAAFSAASGATTPAYSVPIFPTVGDITPTWGRFDNAGSAGAYFVITFDADVINPACAPSVTNTAIVPADTGATQHAVLTPAINQAPLSITGPSANLTVTKTTSTPVVVNTNAAGMTATYTIKVSNSLSTCASTGVNISDALPAGFTYASTGSITYSGTPASAARVGGADPVAGTTNPTWTGFTIPGGGSVTLTFSANIAAGTTNGIYYNSASAVPAEAGAIVNNFGPGAPVQLASANITKIFGAANPAATQLGAVIPLTFTVTKPASGALTGINFTDNLPAGVLVSGTPASSQCGGTVTFTASSITLTGGSIASGTATCTLTANVTSSVSGTYVNDSTNFTSVSPTTSVAGANATLLVSNAALTKTFLAPTIGVAGASILRLTLTNATGGVAHTGLGFVDTLPTNVVIATPNGLVNNCGGSMIAAAGSSSISLSGANLAAGSTNCTVDVTVTSSVPGSYVNNATNIGSLTGGLTAATASATLTVRGTVLEKNFSPNNIGVGGTSALTFNITNGMGNPAQAGLAFTETLPAGVTLSAAPTSAQCGGTVSGTAGGSTITFSGGSLASGASLCSITATVTSATGGTYVNDSTKITGASAGMDTSGVNAALTVANVVLTKQFANSPIATATNVALVFTLTNSPGNPAQSGIAFTDTFPAGLVLGNATGTFGAGCAGTLTNPAGGALALNGTGVKLTGGTMAAGTASCTITVNVRSATPGTYINNYSNISGASAGLATGGVNATLLIDGTTLKVSKITTTPEVEIIGAANSIATYTITVQNTGFATAAGVQVTDTMPASFTYTSTGGITLNGGATRTATANPAAGSASPVWGTFSIPAGDSIAITFNATVPNAQANGTYNNSASVTSTTAGTVSQNFDGTTSTTDDVLVRRVADLTITKAQVTANPVQQGQAGVQYTLKVNNVGGAAKLAGNTVTVTEVPPVGLTVTAISGTNWTCTLATLTCTRTDVLNAGASYADLITVTATVAANAPFTLTNSSNVALTGQTESDTNNNIGSAPPTNVISVPSLSKAFGTNPMGVGGTSVLTFTITNGANNPAQSGLAFTDTLPGNVVVATPNGMVNNCSGTATATAGSGSIALSGGVLVSGTASCTLSVNVTSSTPGNYLNSAANGNIKGLAGGLTATGLADTLVVRGTALTKAFSPAAIVVGNTSVLMFTLANGTGNPAQAGLAFTDTLPTGVTVSGPLTASQCGGTLSSSGAQNISFSNGSLVSGIATCTISVNVTSALAGTYTNNNTNISGASVGLDATGVNATLTVATVAPSISKAFSAPVLGAAITSTLTITLGNTNGAALTGAAFTDNLPATPAQMKVAAVPNVTNTCGGALIANPNTNSVSLSAGSIPSGGCAVSIDVTVPAAGSYVNTIPAGGLTTTNGGISPAVATSTLAINAPDLQITKTHSGNFTVGMNGSYTLTVNNTLGNAATSGTITVIDTLPAGLTYVATGSGGTGWICVVAGQVVTCTSANVINPGAASANPITINVAVSSTAVPGVSNTASVSGGGEPGVNASNNSVADSTIVSNAPVNTFTTDGMQTALPGTAVFYQHTFNAGIAGSVSFGVSNVSAPVVPGWNSLVYLDPLCNGTASPTSLTAPVAVNPGDRVCILIKDNVPATAPYNGQNAITVVATFAPPIGTTENYTRTDITTVGALNSAGLVLQKNVCTINSATNLCVGTPTTGNAAKPGDLLEYVLSYTNTTPGVLTAMVVKDTTPAFTLFDSATCGAPIACTIGPVPALNGTGAIQWNLSAPVPAGAVGNVTFRVRIQ